MFCLEHTKAPDESVSKHIVSILYYTPIWYKISFEFIILFYAKFLWAYAFWRLLWPLIIRSSVSLWLVHLSFYLFIFFAQSMHAYWFFFKNLSIIIIIKYAFVYFTLLLFPWAQFFALQPFESRWSPEGVLLYLRIRRITSKNNFQRKIKAK